MCQSTGITCCVMQQATVSDCWLIKIRSWAILVQIKGSPSLLRCLWPSVDAREEMTGKMQVWSDPAFSTLCTCQLRTLCFMVQQTTVKTHSLMDSSTINLAIPYLNLGILLASSKVSDDRVRSYTPHRDASPFFTLTSTSYFSGCPVRALTWDAAIKLCNTGMQNWKKALVKIQAL